MSLTSVSLLRGLQREQRIREKARSRCTGCVRPQVSSSPFLSPPSSPSLSVSSTGLRRDASERHHGVEAARVRPRARARPHAGARPAGRGSLLVAGAAGVDVSAAFTQSYELCVVLEILESKRAERSLSTPSPCPAHENEEERRPRGLASATKLAASFTRALDDARYPA